MNIDGMFIYIHTELGRTQVFLNGRVVKQLVVYSYLPINKIPAHQPGILFINKK
jgi:hypothetical protein